MQPGDHAIVFGAGPMGCLLMQAVKGAGAARVTMVDHAPKRLEMATQLGTNHVFQADGLTPRGDPPRRSPWVRSGGRCHRNSKGHGGRHRLRPRGQNLVGVRRGPESATARFYPYELFRRDLRVVGTIAINRTFQEAIAMLEGGEVAVEPVVSHTVPLQAFEAGLEFAEHDPDRMKIQFAIAGEG